MKISVDSLNRYLKDKLTTDRLVELILQTEVEVEEIISTNSWDRHIIVAKVDDVRAHPDADKLRLASVNTGTDVVEVVCGAPNLAVGQTVVLAQVGAVLPDGLAIKASKLRGVVSNGMLCSAKELGISDDHTGILVLPSDTPIGATLCDIWQKGDCLDIKTPANRWDYLSLIGLAREVAARDAGNQLVLPKQANLTYNHTENVKVKESGECKRFVSVKIRVDNSVKSPQWLVDNLEGNGIRSISPVVDITNFVMLETGQPSHAYDAAKLHGSLSVRFASPAEKLTTLDGVDRELSEEDLVIADESGAIGLAGVMGGAGTEVDATTTEIILEVANFDRTRVRRTALRHGIRTEASSRFERSLPLPLPCFATERLVQLLQEVVSAEVLDSPSDQLYGWPWVQHVGLRLRKAEKLLGIKLDEREVVEGLTRLGFDVEHFSITKELRKHLGKPYIWGANFKEHGDSGFDCSYLIDRVFSKIGVRVGHTALGQYHHGRPVEVGDLKPGDVVFYGGKIEKSVTDHYYTMDSAGKHTKVILPKPMAVGHNGIYIGQNKVITAIQYERKGDEWVKRQTQGVLEVPLSDFVNDPTYLGARRYVENFNHILAVVAPWWRLDIRSEEDLVEEIVKIVGYDSIPAELPTLPATNTRPHQLLPRLHELRKAMVAAGLQEIVTYSFISAAMIERLSYQPSQHMEIANPLSQDQQYLRTSMLPSHLEMVRTNQRYAKQFATFEIARTYQPIADGQLPQEAWKLAMSVVGPDSVLRLKALLDRLAQYARVDFAIQTDDDPDFAKGRYASVMTGATRVGHYGQLSKRVLSSFGIQPEVSFAEVCIEPILMADTKPVITDLPDYQLVQRDVSLICADTVQWVQIKQLVMSAGKVRSIHFKGLYEDEALKQQGNKNITLRVTLDLGANPSSEVIANSLEAVYRKLQNGTIGEVKIS